jgi:thiamine biosynthesis lipoprotein
MGTECAVTVVHAEDELASRAATEALDVIASVESRLSTWRPDSALSRANAEAAGGRAVLSAALARDLALGLELARRTRGAFDPTIGPLVAAWDLRGDGRIPSPAELARARELVGWRAVELDLGASELSLPAGAWLETGGFGKGLALDQAAAALKAAGIEDALLDFGGQLLAIGNAPGERGWPVAVADPRDRSRPALVLRLQDQSLATSAQSERGRSIGDRFVGHVLNPRSGEPAARLGSASVIAPDGASADAIATALLVLGPEDGISLARELFVAAGYLEPHGNSLVLHSTDLFSRAVLERFANIR